jgi:hypothetical protein
LEVVSLHAPWLMQNTTAQKFLPMPQPGKTPSFTASANADGLLEEIVDLAAERRRLVSRLWGMAGRSRGRIGRPNPLQEAVCP